MGFLLQQGFICSRADSSLFIYCKGSTLIYLLVYVNKILNGSHLSDLDTMKNLGQLHYNYTVCVLRRTGC